MREAAREDGPTATSQAQVKTLLISDLVDSTELFAALGDRATNELVMAHDRMARDLLVEHRGLEIDKTDGFLLMFDEPLDGVGYALAYHEKLRALADQREVRLVARAAIHVGEVYLHRNEPEDVARGAKPLEVEGIAKPTAARVASLAQGKQTLLTQAAFDLARTSAREGGLDAGVRWLAHGPYGFKGLEAPLEVFEVGRNGFAPLTAPPDSGKAHRTITAADAVTLGWRPAPGLEVPLRPGWSVARKLGVGGFGEVWLAANADTGEQRVFKFCYEPESLQTLQREVTFFRFIRSALGQRRNIANIIDWNLEKAPFFIELEYFEGGSLTDWVEKQGGFEALPVSQRLELLAQVAEALAAAHSVGVLHQDVKPDNVLIGSDEGGAPRAVLADFGIGRITNRELLLEKDITALGLSETDATSRGGSRLYQAPELFAGRPPSIQADIYALGVMLFQAVVGDFRRSLAPGWQREVEDELLREDIASFADGAPERRPRDAREIADRLRALEDRKAERARERHAREQAEAARAAAERSRRRRRILVVVSAALAVFSVAMAFQVRRANRAARRAAQEADTSARVSDFMIGLFRINDPDESGGRTVTAKELLDTGAERIRNELSGEPAVQANLMHAMGSAYRSLGLFPPGRALLEESLALRRSLHGGDEDPLVGESLHALGQLLYYSLDYEEARRVQQEAVALRRASLGDRHQDTLAALELLAAIHVQLDQLDQAEPLYREVLAARDAGALADARILGDALIGLAQVLRERGDFDASEPLLLEAIGVYRAEYGEKHTLVSAALSNYAFHLTITGQHAAAEETYRRQLRIDRELIPGQPGLAYTLTGIARLLTRVGRYAEAEAAAREAVAILRSRFAEDTWRTARVQSVLGLALEGQGRHAEAEEVLLASVDFLEAGPGQGEDSALPYGAGQELLEAMRDFYERREKPREAARFQALVEGEVSRRGLAVQ